MKITEFEAVHQLQGGKAVCVKMGNGNESTQKIGNPSSCRDYVHFFRKSTYPTMPAKLNV